MRWLLVVVMLHVAAAVKAYPCVIVKATPAQLAPHVESIVVGEVISVTKVNRAGRDVMMTLKVRVVSHVAGKQKHGTQTWHYFVQRAQRRKGTLECPLVTGSGKEFSARKKHRYWLFVSGSQVQRLEDRGGAAPFVAAWRKRNQISGPMP